MRTSKALVIAALFALTSHSWGDAYKCKTPTGTIIQDTPCRAQTETVRSTADYVSPESTRAANARLKATHDRWSEEEAAAAEAQRIENARQVAIREEQRKYQAIVEQQRLTQEVQAARQEAEAARRAAEDAKRAAEIAAANSGPAPPRAMFCRNGFCF